MFTPEELHILGTWVDGVFSHYEDETIMVFGSNTWPSHRITVDSERARLKLDEHLEAMKCDRHSE